jgi:hypothetical protein
MTRKVWILAEKETEFSDLEPVAVFNTAEEAAAFAKTSLLKSYDEEQIETNKFSLRGKHEHPDYSTYFMWQQFPFIE